MRKGAQIALLASLTIVLITPALRGSEAVISSQAPGTGVGIDQKLGVVIPGDLIFQDEAGKSVRLGDYLGEKPVILSLVYFHCPGLCTVTLNSLVQGLKPVEDLQPGRDFECVIVSFDPRETPDLATAKKKQYLQQFGRPGTDGGWHFLTGDSSAIHRLSDAVGFHYRWDESTQQFAHPGGIIILTPDGKVSRYMLGEQYPPADLRAGLSVAGAGATGLLDDQPLLYCFQFNLKTGRVALNTTRALRLGAVLTVASIGVLLLVVSRKKTQPAERPET